VLPLRRLQHPSELNAASRSRSNVMKVLAALYIIALFASSAQAADLSSHDMQPVSLTTPEPPFAVTMSRWPVWSVNSGWSLFNHSGRNNGLLNPMPSAALSAILAPLWDPWLHTVGRGFDEWAVDTHDDDAAAAELQLSLRPGVSMLWELTNDGALLEFDDVTVSLGVRIRF